MGQKVTENCYVGNANSSLIHCKTQTKMDLEERNLLELKIKNLEKECLMLKNEQTKLKNNIDILNARLETYTILNERLQIKNYCYEQRLKELGNDKETIENEVYEQKLDPAVQESFLQTVKKSGHHR
ncbi:uncharacterized protein LOC131663383 [Phymastichus coffea]|uniref:uncharacterized protein LOC131663383 n=1 Tax=Phymastichus coffea TaxID=108790 RepID=UPI00273AF6E6|nr:uncharacterized protein LOC131663383 [Phymastichus coffea]